MEMQIESEGSGQLSAAKKRLTPEAAEAFRKKESLLLARTRMLAQFQASTNPRHREMMERALADLEKALAKFPSA